MQSNLALEWVSPSALTPNTWNTNKITDPADEERLRKSLKRLGTFKPILVRTLADGSLQILGGEHRWKVAESMGMQTVPILNLGEVEDRRAKEIGLADNARYGDDDPSGLKSLLSELGAAVFDFIPFDEAEIASLKAVDDHSGMLEDLDATPPKSIEDLVPKAPKDQIMRFKVPIEDSTWVQALIEQEMKRGGYRDEDALTNAGHALVALLNRARKAE